MSGQSEQGELPLTPGEWLGRIERLYRAWRLTAWGQVAYADVAALALESPEPRLSINSLVETVRANHRVPINNTFRALMSRELMEEYPSLRGKFKIRRESPHQVEWYGE